MAIFNSYVKLPEGKSGIIPNPLVMSQMILPLRQPFSSGISQPATFGDTKGYFMKYPTIHQIIKH